MIALTKMQLRILRVIESFWADRGYAPSLGDIAQGVGLSSRSSVRYQIGQMEKLGLIVRDPLLSRTIRVKDTVAESYERADEVAQ